MKTITETFSLPATADRVWALLLDESYLRPLYLGELGFDAFTVLAITESSRKLRLTPRLSLPGPLQKLLGDKFTYEDHGTLDRAAGLWTWRMVQPADADGGKSKSGLVTTHGTIRLSPDGDGRTKRTDTITAEAHVFGLGGLIESTVEKETRASWTKEIAYLRRRLSEAG